MTSKEKEEKISFDGGAGGDATYLANGPDRNARWSLEEIAGDTGSMEFYVGRDPIPALELDSDGSILVHSRKVGVDRRIYLGFRTYALPHWIEGPNFHKVQHPAEIDGVPLRKYAVSRRVDGDKRYIMATGAGGLGDKSNGGKDGRDGRLIFGRLSPPDAETSLRGVDEILRFEGGGVVKTGILTRPDADGWMRDVEETGEIVRDGDRIVDLLRTFLREAGLLPEEA